MSKYSWDQCQVCGEHIGLLGRFVEWIYGTMGMTFTNHDCKPLNVKHFSLIRYIINYLKIKYLKLKIWRITRMKK